MDRIRIKLSQGPPQVERCNILTLPSNIIEHHRTISRAEDQTKHGTCKLSSHQSVHLDTGFLVKKYMVMICWSSKSDANGSGDQVTQVSIGIVAWDTGYWFDTGLTTRKSVMCKLRTFCRCTIYTDPKRNNQKFIMLSLYDTWIL